MLRAPGRKARLLQRSHPLLLCSAWGFVLHYVLTYRLQQVCAEVHGGLDGWEKNNRWQDQVGGGKPVLRGARGGEAVQAKDRQLTKARDSCLEDLNFFQKLLSFTKKLLCLLASSTQGIIDQIAANPQLKWT